MALDFLDKQFNTVQKEGFCRELSSGVLSHAYIVEGEEGFGKTFFAFFAAAAILCSGNNKPCGVCSSCKKIGQNSHPDLIVIAPDREGGIITVGMVREIKRSIYLLPNESDKKVYIIKDGHKMNVQAQNALLKFFEEPPPSAVFFILTDKKESLLPTVVSRGRIITLYPSPKEKIAAWLAGKFPRKDKEEINYAAAMSEGSPGKAVSLLEKKQSDIKNDVTDFAKILFTGSDFDLVAFLKAKKYDRNKAKEFLSAVITLADDILRAKQRYNRYTLLTPEAALEYAGKTTDKKLLCLAEEAILAYESINANSNLNLTLASIAARLNEIKR